MEAKFIARTIQKSLSVLYVGIGLYSVYDISQELWMEGAFGNKGFEGCILAPLGPEIGFLWWSAAISLTVGQSLVFFNNKLGTHFSRISFLLAVLTLVCIYLIFKRWYTWSYVIDFSLYLFLLVLFYLPVLRPETLNSNRETRN